MTVTQSKPLISLLLPTRGRREFVDRFLDSVANTSSLLEFIEIVICVDEDDLGSQGIVYSGLRIIELVGPRRSMGDYNSDALHVSHGEIVVLVNDDMVIRTTGWDERLRAMHVEYPDGIYLAYCNDLLKGKSLSTFPILSRHCCEWLVEPYPHAYQGAFIDYHLFDVFKRLEKAGHHRMVYLEDVIFEHLHFRVGKAPMDATYAARSRFGDDPVFLALSVLRQEQANWLMEAICGIEQKKHMLPEVPLTRIHGIPHVFAHYTRWIIADRGMPLLWRLRLWIWFLARYVVSSVWKRRISK